MFNFQTSKLYTLAHLMLLKFNTQKKKMLLKFTIVNEAEKNDHPVAEKYSLYKIVIKVNFLFYKSPRKVNRLMRIISQ